MPFASPPATSNLAGKITGGLSILLVMDLAYFINAMDRQVFPIILPDVREALGVTPSQIGLMATIFTLGMGLAGIPAGYLSDRFGRKNMILGGLAVFSVTTMLQAFAFGWFDMAVYRIVSGIGEGVQNAALYAAAGSFFYLNRGLAIGTLSAAYGLGAFTGPALGQVLVDATGHWQSPLIVYGVLGGVIFVIVLICIPRFASEYGAERTDATAAAEMGVAPSQNVFNRVIVCSAVVAASAGFALYAWLGLYPTYLRETAGFSPGQASIIASAFGIGALAAVLGGLAADRFDQRMLNVIGVVTFGTTGALIFALADAPMPVHIVLTLLMGASFTGVIYTNTSTLMQRSVAPALVGRAQGVFLAALYIPASVSGYVFAELASAVGWAVGGVLIIAIPSLISLAAMVAMGKVDATTPTTVRLSPERTLDDGRNTQ